MSVSAVYYCLMPLLSAANSRAEQDAYALESYRRAAEAWDAGRFAEEVFAVEVPQVRLFLSPYLEPQCGSSGTTVGLS